MKENTKLEITEDDVRQEIEKITKHIEETGYALTAEKVFEVDLLYKEKIKFRSHITKLEEKMRKHHAVSIDDYCPLKHTFGEGYLIREINTPAGELIITKIHKQNHPFFLLKGKCSVLTEDGVKYMEAPYYGITSVGTKRIIYCHTDVVWVCVHITESTDIEKIEEDIIAKDFNDPAITKEDVKILTEILKDKKC